MHRDGVIALPPPKGRQYRPKPIVFGPETEPPLFPPPTTLDEVRTLEMRTVVRGTREGRLWNEFVARYHYLGYRTLVGAQMRYAVHDRNGWPIAMLGFSTAAWKLAPRDNFIGWTPQLREKNLPLVVDNGVQGNVASGEPSLERARRQNDRHPVMDRRERGVRGGGTNGEGLNRGAHIALEPGLLPSAGVTRHPR